ncbi:MAG: cytochrome b/b6 domain-containing protein [Pseudomonadota bacterium]
MSPNESMTKIYLYKRFERFWHWVQALLVIILIVTGFEIHGAWRLFGFEEAVEIHGWCGWAWIILYAFIIFWLFTTGEWKQYIPTTKKLLSMVGYYSLGIFKGDPHPMPKSERIKHNPLQRLTYLGIASVIIPLQMITGALYYNYNHWISWDWRALTLGSMAFIHTAGAFAIFIFLIVHVYMTTTGHGVSAHIKAMITGWEEVPETETPASE